ncbi:GNAT family N-acetyltransferase [Tepidimicrobium xylanilyticum]|uniref:Acetyltransferase (GNAT) family protein n=1 Tax=Tepidimicrobium xylanilyticum TaxID=1123352 RepID=A0A1H3C0E3_9FIRM|nr:GNAT family N-acetyltransferase [Tepidimicrobium xylanilyticum]GMG97313.1 hypothetical protein EN5CB1_21390 [Tepidimicrobium xylanilyticum]SDX47673.1 Acetyltransferase (GNAT) family protein [Tepidimicrobium xylanilyticum]
MELYGENNKNCFIRNVGVSEVERGKGYGRKLILHGLKEAKKEGSLKAMLWVGNVEDINFEEKVNIVGITVTVDVFPRVVEIARVYQKGGIPVVSGGIHISAFPEQAKEYFDVVAVGMAETTWPNIIQDFQDKKLKRIY